MNTDKVPNNNPLKRERKRVIPSLKSWERKQKQINLQLRANLVLLSHQKLKQNPIDGFWATNFEFILLIMTSFNSILVKILRIIKIKLNSS